MSATPAPDLAWLDFPPHCTECNHHPATMAARCATCGERALLFCPGCHKQAMRSASPFRCDRCNTTTSTRNAFEWKPL